MNIFQNMTSRKLSLFVGIAAIALIMVVFMWWVMSSSWRPLLASDTELGVRQEAMLMLTQWGIAYKEDTQSGDILVQSQDLDIARQQLGDAGVPAINPVGLELFEDSGLGMSEFAQRINYQRGLEGELSRTIRSFLDVRAARIHLTMPKESLFKDRQEAAKASVVIDMREGQSLSYDNVLGVQSLVSAAVENLSAEDVIVLDNQGKLLSGSMGDSHLTSYTPEHDMTAAYETKARELLLGTTGGADFKVAVSVKINYDRVTSIQEKLIPAEGQTGYVVRHTESSIVDTSSENGQDRVPEQSSIDEEYLFSRETSEIEYATGKVEQVSVGIVVMSELSEERLDAMTRVIVSGLGLSLENGDRVEIIAVASPEIVVPPQVAEQTNVQSAAPTVDTAQPTLGLSNLRTEQATMIAIGALAGVLLSLLIALLMFPRKRRSKESISTEDRAQLLSEARAWLAENRRTSIAGETADV